MLDDFTIVSVAPRSTTLPPAAVSVTSCLACWLLLDDSAARRFVRGSMLGLLLVTSTAISMLGLLPKPRSILP